MVIVARLAVMIALHQPRDVVWHQIHDVSPRAIEFVLKPTNFFAFSVLQVLKCSSPHRPYLHPHQPEGM